jgi:hypothetical protein
MVRDAVALLRKMEPLSFLYRHAPRGKNRGGSRGVRIAPGTAVRRRGLDWPSR